MRSYLSTIPCLVLALSFMTLAALSGKVLSAAQTSAASTKDKDTDVNVIDKDQPRFALLVGINDYKNPTIPHLSGSENDVALMKDTLQNYYGFNNQSIKTLCGAQANRDAILDNFRTHLIDTAKKAKEQGKEAIVVFYFSGHGARYADPEKVELNGWDEAIVPWDSRTGDVFDIIDKEISDLVSELTQHTSREGNVTLIFDSCHSGDLSKGELEVKEIPADTRARQPAYTRKRDLPDKNQYVTIAATLSNGIAFVRPADSEPDSKINSYLTYHLAAALKRASKHTTYDELMSGVKAAVNNERHEQYPQVEGDVNRPVFGSGVARSEPGFDGKVADDLVTFEAGRAQGVQIGTRIAIYAKGSGRYVGKEGWLTNGTVIKVGDLSSLARMDSSVKEKEAKVILAAPTFGGMPLAVSLGDASLSKGVNDVAALRRDIEQELEKVFLIRNQLVKLVDAPSSVGPTKSSVAGLLRLKRGKFKDVFRDPKDIAPQESCTEKGDVLPADSDEVFYLDEGTSLPLFGQFVRADDPQAAAKIAELIEDRAKQRNLRSLENGNSALNEAVRVTLQRLPGTLITKCFEGKKKFTGWDRTSQGKPVQGKNELPVGAFYNFKVQNLTEQSLYVILIGVFSDGKIEVIYAPQTREEAFRGGQTRDLPLTGARFTLAPAGVDTFKIIVVAVDPNPFKGPPKFDFLSTHTRLTSKGDESLLERLLKQSGLKTRDDVLPADQPNLWGVVDVELVVKE